MQPEAEDTSVLSAHQADGKTCRIDVDGSHETSNKLVDNSGQSEPDRFPVRSITDDSKCESNVFPMCKNGVLDLSRRGLNKINRRFRKEYANVRNLIISGNMFTNVVGFDMFKQCVQVDATDNQLSKLTWFVPFATQLRVLLLSNNGITNIDCLRSFVNLETLDVSCNDIKTIPSGLDNAHLQRLDLSSNAITSLPDLQKLSFLNHLDVSSNRISSFKTAVFPQCLTFLDASSNTIEDLTEFLYLLPLAKLESIALANNPCISSPTFDYRIYILSVLPSVQDIDGFLVSEEDQLKGEWLYSQGKGRTFKPGTGAHGSLVNYLERYCPFDIDGKRVSSLDQSIVKVMEKRREILSSSSIEEDSSLSLSVHSPYGAWAAHVIEGKENRLPNSSTDEMPRHLFSAKMQQSSTPAEELCARSTTILQFEPPSRSSTLESIESSSTVTLVPAVKNSREDNRNVASTEAICADRSRRSHLRERILQREQDSELKGETGRTQPNNKRNATPSASLHSVGTDTPRFLSTKSKSDERSTTRHERQKSNHSNSVAVVTDISMDMGSIRSSRRLHYEEDDVIRRIEFLEDRVKTISDENENLTRINDELSKFLVERTEKFTV